jgi:hypothetical protein
MIRTGFGSPYLYLPRTVSQKSTETKMGRLPSVDDEPNTQADLGLESSARRDDVLFFREKIRRKRAKGSEEI